MMELKLRAEKRDMKTKARVLRKQDKLPAVFYGRKEKSTPITLSHDDFIKVWREAGESGVITLTYPGKELNVLIHDVALDPVEGDPLHADFYVVEADRPVEVKVLLEFEGVAPAVKELGGTLVKVLHEVLVRGLSKDLPQTIEVPISSLKTLESRLLAKNLALPPAVELLTNPNEVVAAIAQAKEEEEVVEEFDVSQVEVEKKGKEEEEAKEGEGGEKKEETKYNS